MDNALGLHALPAAQRCLFHQQRGIAQAAQTRIEPETGDAAANDQDIGAEGFGHGADLAEKQGRQYKPDNASG